MHWFAHCSNDGPTAQLVGTSVRCPIIASLPPKEAALFICIHLITLELIRVYRNVTFTATPEMNFLFLFLVTFALLASTIAFSVRPPVATDKMSVHSLLEACDNDVHLHARNDPAAAPSLVAVPICLSLPTKACLHLDTSNTTMFHKTSNDDVVTAVLSGALTTALSGAVTTALSGFMYATILFGADVHPAHAVPTAMTQSLQNIESNQVEMMKELKQLSASQKELSASLQELSASQQELSASMKQLSEKVDRNQQELSLKIGQVDYKFIWIPIIVSLANIVLPPRER
jgi:hypothetical protein